MQKNKEKKQDYLEQMKQVYDEVDLVEISNRPSNDSEI